ncbi:MAG: hypothetical protein KA354_23350 [Phycisphaerae bacterium]|nr:hypothetical protein [Phycisphaerae bacterium]
MTPACRENPASCGGDFIARPPATLEKMTEPTPSGEHDLKRVVELTRHFDMPLAVCINKWDINPKVAERIEDFCRSHSILVAGRIRYDRAFTAAQVQGRAIVEARDDGVAMDVRNLWASIRSELDRGALDAV